MQCVRSAVMRRLEADCARIDCKSPLYEPRHKKTVVGVSDQVRQKPGCAAKEGSSRLEISADLVSGGIVLTI